MTTPSPQEQCIGFAVITTAAGSNTRWLLVRDPEGTYRLPGETRCEDEPFADCVARGIQSQLGLDPAWEFSLGEKPLAHLRYEPVGGSETEPAIIELFALEPTGSDQQNKLAAHPDTAWLSWLELSSGYADDARPISDMVPALLLMGHLVPEEIRTEFGLDR